MSLHLEHLNPEQLAAVTLPDEHALILAGAAGLFVAAVLGVLTVQQSSVWKDSITLWDHALALDRSVPLVWANHGMARMHAGDIQGRIVIDFQK